jgi:hypothetical protein
MNAPTLILQVDGNDAAKAFISFWDGSVVVHIVYPNEGEIRFIYPEDRVVAEVEGFLKWKHEDKGQKVAWRKSKPAEARDYEKKFRAILKKLGAGA